MEIDPDFQAPECQIGGCMCSPDRAAFVNVTGEDDATVIEWFGHWDGSPEMYGHWPFYQGTYNISWAHLEYSSLFYDFQPSFASAYSWPAIGPKLLENDNFNNISQNIPARDRFNYSIKTFCPNPFPWPPTTSGALSSDENWWDSVTLTGNVTVPAGITLTIKTGTTVNLNGYYIKSTGGTIVRESSVTFVPEDICVKSGSTLKGQYSTIKSAVDNASSGQTVYPASDSYTITENITIPTGVTLSLASSTTLNFSGASYITVNSGGSVVADDQYYTSITFDPSDRGVRYSGTMSVNNKWGFPVLVTSALTVPSGVTLNIIGGTTVTFVNGANNKLEILAGGHINAEGRDFAPIIFTSQTPAYYGWKGVYAYGSDNLFYQCQFEYATYGLKLYGTPNQASDNIVGSCSFEHNFWGLYIENNDDPNVNSCHNIANNYYGITLNNNDWAWIYNNWIFSNCDEGVFSYLDNEVRFRECLMKENEVGVYSDDDNHIDFSWEDGYGGGNSIHDNNSYGVRIEDYNGEWAALDWIDHSQLPNSVYDNDVDDEGDEDVWAYNAGKIMYASEVYWGDNVPNDSYNCYLGYEPNHPANYTVDNSDPLASDYTGLQKKIAVDFTSFSVSDSTIGDNSNGRYGEIDEEKLKEDIESNLDSEKGVALLTKLYHYNHLKAQTAESRSLVITDLVQYLEMLYTNNKNSMVGEKTLPLLVSGKMQQDKYEESITLCKEGLIFLDNDDWRRLVERLIWLYIHTEKYDEAGEVLADLKSQYKNDRKKIIAFLENKLLDALQMSQLPELQKKSLTEKYIMPVDFELERNYPNPFNPMTKIRYRIPEESKVILKIFDSLGREVAKLVDEYQGVGYYQINWDARGLPSGIYLYQMRASGFQKTRKMLLVK